MDWVLKFTVGPSKTTPEPFDIYVMNEDMACFDVADAERFETRELALDFKNEMTNGVFFEIVNLTEDKRTVEPTTVATLMEKYFDEWSVSEKPLPDGSKLVIVRTPKHICPELKAILISSATFYGGPCKVEFALLLKGEY